VKRVIALLISALHASLDISLTTPHQNVLIVVIKSVKRVIALLISALHASLDISLTTPHQNVLPVHQTASRALQPGLTNVISAIRDIFSFVAADALNVMIRTVMFALLLPINAQPASQDLL